MARMRAKTGLMSARADDLDLIRDLLRLMAEANEGRGADFTLTFRHLSDASLGPAHMGPLSMLFPDQAPLEAWLTRWRQRLAGEGTDPESLRQAMQAANPAFIPRNHRVEEALTAAHSGDMAPFATLAAILARPFDDQPEHEDYMQPAPASFGEYRTFCGT
jgi:uncharacterized protein YdiU (UPF0061 family)